MYDAQFTKQTNKKHAIDFKNTCIINLQPIIYFYRILLRKNVRHLDALKRFEQATRSAAEVAIWGGAAGRREVAGGGSRFLPCVDVKIRPNRPRRATMM